MIHKKENLATNIHEHWINQLEIFSSGRDLTIQIIRNIKFPKINLNETDQAHEMKT